MRVERVVLNHDGARQLLLSAQMTALMSEHANRVAVRAGSGYRPSTWRGDSRMIGSVETDTAAAIRRESRTHGLLRALGG